MSYFRVKLLAKYEKYAAFDGFFGGFDGFFGGFDGVGAGFFWWWHFDSKRISHH
jgi:hypothetical protein